MENYPQMKTETQIFFLEVNIGLTVIKGNQRLCMVTKFKMNFLSSAELSHVIISNSPKSSSLKAFRSGVIKKQMRV